MAYFSKEDIVKLAKKENFFEEDFTDDTLENKLNNLIDFLIDSKIVNNDDIFFSALMNIDQSKPRSPYKPYKFNVSTYIFLCLLLEFFDDEYFYEVYRGKGRSYQKADSLMVLFENSIPKYKSVWENNAKRYLIKKYNINWATFSFYVQDQIYNLLTPDSKSKKIKGIDREIAKIAISFLSLPDNLKIKAYEKSENRLNYINEKIISQIEKEVELDTIYKIDKEMLEGKLKEYL